MDLARQHAVTLYKCRRLSDGNVGHEDRRNFNHPLIFTGERVNNELDGAAPLADDELRPVSEDDRRTQRSARALGQIARQLVGGERAIAVHDAGVVATFPEVGGAGHGVLERALELYAEKLQAEAEKHIADFGAIKVLNGRFGAYITDGKKNAKIPKDTDLKTITEVIAKKLLAEAPAKGKGRRISKRKKS